MGMCLRNTSFVDAPKGWLSDEQDGLNGDHDDVSGQHEHYGPTPVENVPCLEYGRYGRSTLKQRCATSAK